MHKRSIVVSFAALRAAEPTRPEGYFFDVVKRGKIEGDSVRLTLDDWNELRRKYAEPVPRSQWPLWAKAIAFLANDDEAGVGDTVKRLIGNYRSEAFKSWHKRTFGFDCGCAKRQKEWNERFNYASKK